MAYTKKIEQNSTDSHQTNPGYVLTFTRWSNRDTVNYKENNLKTRKPLVVVNDAISISVQNNKSSPTPTFSCTLRQGDINYLTAIAPGDYVMVNMLDWQEDAMKIRERAINGKSINRKDDGFKGVFKVSDVNMVLLTSPNGPKQFYVQISARGFDEYNNLLYFNPAMSQEKALKGVSPLFLNAFSDFEDLLQEPNTNNVQKLAKEVIKRTTGEGLANILKEGTKLNQIPAYKIPLQMGSLLNLKQAKSMIDLNKHYLGIWQPNNTGFSSFFKPDDGNAKDDAKGRFFNTGMELQGSRAFVFDNFQNIKVWSLLKDYSNPVLNEAYTCYRLAPDNHVYPSIIVRQKPFSTNHYKKFVDNINKDSDSSGIASNKVSNHTKFLDLPRWKVDAKLIKSLNIGRSDSGRINFVQVFSRSMSINQNFDQALQIEVGNFVEDKKDIIRNGRKPYIVTCNYDYPGADQEFRAKEWAMLVADWLLNGHLKLNGNVKTVGIQDPICVGDNLELDGNVYHIESTSHILQITANGKISFETDLTLSMGVDLKSNSEVPVYGEMDYTDSYTRRKDDYKNEKLTPGFSDTQDLPSRDRGEEKTETKEATFTNPSSVKKGNK